MKDFLLKLSGTIFILSSMLFEFMQDTPNLLWLAGIVFGGIILSLMIEELKEETWETFDGISFKQRKLNLRKLLSRKK